MKLCQQSNIHQDRMLQSDQFNTPPRPRRAPQRDSAPVDGNERPSPRPSSRKQRQRPAPQPHHNRTVSASIDYHANSMTGSGGHTGATPPIAMTPARPMSTPSKAAYAGPTFNASPAPSSLPIPKLLSKSAPDGAVGAQATKESPPPEQPEQMLGRGNSYINDHSRVTGNSPLDIFFRADREEKARLKSGSQPDLGSPDGLDPRRLSGPDSPSPSFRRPARDDPPPPPPVFPTAATMASPDGGEARSPGYPIPRQRHALANQARQNVHRSHTAPSAVPGGADTDEAQQLMLKSQALKSLLGL